MKQTFLMILAGLLFLQTFSQKIIYSDLGKSDFINYRFDVIGKYKDKILVYNDNYEMYIYDAQMKIQQKVALPLPRFSSGVHFIVHDDYFYMFYQFKSKHIVYCMAAKIGIDGKLIGQPIIMDNTTDVSDVSYSSQIYSVVNSEDKKQIIAFKVNARTDSGYLLTSISFDENLHTVQRFTGFITNDLYFHLSEYAVDDDGNFIFTGLTSSSWKNNNNANAFLFMLRKDKNELVRRTMMAPDFFTNRMKLLVDNKNKRYIIASFYSNSWGGNIKGLNIVTLNAPNDSIISVTNTLLADSTVSAIGKSAKRALNNFFIEHIQLKSDGGFLILAEELDASGTDAPWWGRLDLLPSKIDYEFLFYDAYQAEHYYPGIPTGEVLFFSFNAKGSAEWERITNSFQDLKLRAILGYKCIVTDDLIYLLFNEIIHNKAYLIAESIDASGKINTDPRLKENKELDAVKREYDYFPRYAEQISSNEIIISCKKGGEMCLAKIEF